MNIQTSKVSRIFGVVEEVIVSLVLGKGDMLVGEGCCALILLDEGVYEPWCRL